MRSPLRWHVIKRQILLVFLVFIGLLLGCAFQRDSLRVSREAEAHARAFLQSRVCLSMPESEFKERIGNAEFMSILSSGEGHYETVTYEKTGFQARHFRGGKGNAAGVTHLVSGDGYFEIGYKGELGLRAQFQDGSFVGYSRWNVEVTGWWRGPYAGDFSPCFYDEQGKIREVSFSPEPTHVAVKGTTLRALRTAYLGRHLVINWQDGLSKGFRPGADLPAGTRIKIGPRYNERIFGLCLDDDRDCLTQDGLGEHKVLFVPEGSVVHDLIMESEPND